MQRGYVYMLRFRKKDSKELIKRMAKTNGCSVSEIRREMQYAIDEARIVMTQTSKRNFNVYLEIRYPVQKNLFV
mgnify:FL=1